LPFVVRQPRIRLAAKIWLASVAVLLLGLGLAGLGAELLLRRQGETLSARRLETALSALRRQADRQTWTEDRLPDAALLETTLPAGSAGWVVAGEAGEPAARWPAGIGSPEWPDGLPGRIGILGTAEGTALAGGQRYRARGMRLAGERNRTVGMVVVGVPAGPEDAAAARFRGRLAAGLAVLALAGAILLAVAAARISHPLPALMEASSRLSLGDLDHRTSVSTRDELGVLACTLNDAAATLKRDREQLRQAGRARAWRDVARRVAHEIKNPLAGMRIAAENLRRAAGRDEETLRESVEEASEVVVEEVAALTRLADAFSSLARMPEPRPAPMDLNDLLEKVASLARAEAPEGVAVETRPDADLPAIRADEGQVGQILKNLLKNALEAVGEGPGRIVAETAGRGDLVEARVADTSPGVPAGERERIFEPYRTSKEEGSGLGLALSRQIAEAHGGRLTVEEATEGGACFILELPLEPPPGEVEADA